MTERRLFISGGTGYVGSALVPFLSQQGYKITVFCLEAFGNSIANTPNVEFIQGDIRDYDAVRQAMEGCTDIINLAGIVTSELVDMNVAKSREVNIGGIENMKEAAAQVGVQRFLHMSSSSVYGSTDTPATEGTLPKPQDEYAKTKLEQERELFTPDDYNPFMRVAIRSATLCGPAPRMRLDTIVNVFSKQAWFDHEITVWGGAQMRSNVHVMDLCEVYKILLERDDMDRRIFNISNANMTALEIAQLARNVCYIRRKQPVIRITVDSNKADNRHYQMDCSSAIEMLGWLPKHSIADAMLENYDFFAAGKIDDPNADLYFNTRRMAASMQEA